MTETKKEQIARMTGRPVTPESLADMERVQNGVEEALARKAKAGEPWTSKPPRAGRDYSIGDR